MKITIETGGLKLTAELNDSATAKAVYEILPITGMANVWGEEIYFSIPLHIDQASDAKQEVNIGDLGFWPVGDAFCIFFGPTPVSTSDLPKAYSPVNVFGKITGDATLLKKVSNGEELRILKEE
ncbi:cyclophilin-like fold protein [Bacteroidota bacterium]